MSDPHARVYLDRKESKVLRIWKYQVTLANGDTFVVGLASGSRDPLTVIRKDLQPLVIDIATLS